MNGTAFLTYVNTQPRPALKPGNIVVCDNLSSHKVAVVREMIEHKGANILYLPPYSPNQNPLYGKPPNDPLMRSKSLSAASSQASGPKNAPHDHICDGPYGISIAIRLLLEGPPR